MKRHFDYDPYEEYITILCKYTWWKNIGDQSFPDWPTTTKKEEVSCMNCLRIIEAGMRCLDD